MYTDNFLPFHMTERDACGIGFVAHRYGERGHHVLQLALTALANHVHRGAVADDGKSGDGSGVLTHIPVELFHQEIPSLDSGTFPPEDWAVGVFFLSRELAGQKHAHRILHEVWNEMGGQIIAWRDVPVRSEVLGERARASQPEIVHVFFKRPPHIPAGGPFERALYLARRRMEKKARDANLRFYVASLSSHTMVYKGLTRADMLADFYPDLQNPQFTTAIAVFHQRYSTNTTPAWERAQPFRFLCHNGEINTLQGNIRWMHAREPLLASPRWGQVLQELLPVIDNEGSDSAMLDNVLELLVRSGRDIRHAMLMLIPEAWEHLDDYPPERRAFYHYHALLMEPWDGPAAVTFTDGRIVGTILDRNGLRPSRYVILRNGLVISASEAGAMPVEEEHIVVKGRLGPGQILAVDTHTGDILTDDQVTHLFATRQPYRQWLEEHLIRLADVRTGVRYTASAQQPDSDVPRRRLQIAFGWTAEDLAYVVRPMARDGKEAIGAMGDDTPLAALSALPRSLYHHFKQRFAEVTNPPIDPLREEHVMSLTMWLGARHNILEESPDAARLLEIHTPILTEEDMGRILALADGRALPRENTVYRQGILQAPRFIRVKRLSTLWEVNQGPHGMREALNALVLAAEKSVREGYTILILSDRGVDRHKAPLPALLATSAVHHHLIRRGLRMKVSLIVESGEIRETHHVATLIGYGASAVHPYLALAEARAYGSEEAMRHPNMSPARAEANLIQALEKGLLKIMSKMGIATLDAYAGAQIFQIIGLDHTLVEQYFPDTPNTVGGLTLDHLANRVIQWHNVAFRATVRRNLPHWGLYKPRRQGETHRFDHTTVQILHQAVRTPHVLGKGFFEGYEKYRVFVRHLQEKGPLTIRDLLHVRSDRSPISLDEVEPVESIVQRFSTAAMSHGSLSREAHETLAIAMNRLAGLIKNSDKTFPYRAASNSGEGGEAPERYGTLRNSAIKQVASGRFGVTPAYLISARELQIKMAQGSKPGEGGHLPGHKVTAEIARLRHAVEGTPLISPPPHHDIYSIEDLAQLIYDLRQIHPRADISVKLVSQAGVGTIAAGVAKGHADVILISGADGGTGASPWSSIKHAGIPWELGLVETQRVLAENGLRTRVRLRVDGGLATGRDVILGALLGADEFSFGTAALIAEGCIMARVCNRNTCPVGVATQRPELRAKFSGRPEHVMAYFLFVAQEVREHLAAMGYRRLDDIVGRSDLLEQGIRGAEAGFLDLTPLLQPVPQEHRRFTSPSPPNTEPHGLNERLLQDAQGALETSAPIVLHYRIRNVDRTIGARLAGVIAQRKGNNGLPSGTITAVFHGSAGQSFGAFNMHGMHLHLIGEANDYVGKSMHGGEIVLRPSYAAQYDSHTHVILGNTALYGATGGYLFAAGRAGERFAVRNSGAIAVVEGVGDHGCEYMTGGVVVVLGETGRNFAAGMTGGQAFVYDPRRIFPRRLNRGTVTLQRVSPELWEDLYHLIRTHHEKTGSSRAGTILRHWSSAIKEFWHVVPKGKKSLNGRSSAPSSERSSRRFRDVQGRTRRTQGEDSQDGFGYHS